MKRQSHSITPVQIYDESSKVSSGSVQQRRVVDSIERRPTIKRKAFGDLTPLQVSSRNNVNAGTVVNSNKGNVSNVEEKTNSLNSENSFTSVKGIRSVTNSNDEGPLASQHDLEQEAICYRLSKEEASKQEAVFAAIRKTEMLGGLKSEREIWQENLKSGKDVKPPPSASLLVSFVEFFTGDEQCVDFVEFLIDDEDFVEFVADDERSADL